MVIVIGVIAVIGYYIYQKNRVQNAVISATQGGLNTAASGLGSGLASLFGGVGTGLGNLFSGGSSNVGSTTQPVTNYSTSSDDLGSGDSSDDSGDDSDMG